MMPLSKFRRSAERYCEILGLDPLEEITQDGRREKRWFFVAEMLREKFAIKIALNQQTL